MNVDDVLDRLEMMPHWILVYTEQVGGASSRIAAPGYNPAKPYMHPSEVPAFVRKRVIDFLEGIQPVVPSYLENALPQKELLGARQSYRELREAGMNAGEAVMKLGILDRPLSHLVPDYVVGRIVARGCDCCGKEDLLVGIACGEKVGDRYRAVRCHETSANVRALTAKERAAAEAAQKGAARQRLERLRALV